MTDNDWDAERKLVLHRLDTLDKRFDTTDATLKEISTALTVLKTQRNSLTWLSNLVLPAIVAALITWATSVAIAGR